MRSAASAASSACRATGSRARRLDRRRRNEDPDRRRTAALRRRRRDLVNHCVNDILVVSTRRRCSFSTTLRSENSIRRWPPRSSQAVAHACRANRCALLGGETAEMPGLYAAGTLRSGRHDRRRRRIDDDPETGKRRSRRCDRRIAGGRFAHERLLARARADSARRVRTTVRRHDVRRRAARRASVVLRGRCARFSTSRA